MIIGVVLLAILATVLAVVLMGGEDDGTATGASPSASAAAISSVPSPTGSASSPTATSSAGEPEPSPGEFAVDTIVASTVDGLSVRAAPGRDAERRGTLASGALSFVAGGPTDADGYRWYLVSTLGLPPNTGCATEIETDPFNCPVWFGWVAAASETGEAWLTPHQIECPPQPFTAEGLILARTNLERLACFGKQPITFRAWWPTIPDDAGLGGACTAQDQPSGWLLCQNINYTMVTINENEGFGGVGVRVAIDPASGLVMPERGTWVELRIHLDDPAAQGCDEAASTLEAPDQSAEQYVLGCRAEMVLEAVQAVDGPG